MSVPTPHNAAKLGEIAKTVLMPGDPLRSKFIAENFLENPILVNDVRGVQGYTGTWKGVPVTVMASGMGIPSIGIYSWELYTEYGAENIIRIGSAGALQDDIKVMDIVMAQGACTDSNFMHQFKLMGTFAPIADYTLLRTAMEIAEAKGIHRHGAKPAEAHVAQRRKHFFCQRRFADLYFSRQENMHGAPSQKVVLFQRGAA